MGRGGEELLSPKAQQSTASGGGGDLQSNQRFLPFLSENFDAAQFASNALADTQTTAQTQIDYLQQGIALLDAQLRQLVLQNRGELISHTSKLDEADVSLQRISLSVRSLQSVAARVRAEVMEPYQQIVTRTQQLSNVQRTVDLLRHTIHRVKLVQRLRAEMSSPNAGIMEAAKAARLLSDIRAADSEADLSGLAVVDSDIDFIATTNVSVRTQINAALRAGLDTLSQAEVGTALQALYNLQELRPAIESHIDSVVASTEKIFSAAMDPKKLSAATPSSGGALSSSSSSSAAAHASSSSSYSSASNGGASAGMRGVVGALQGTTVRVQEALWDRLREAFEGLWRSGVAMWHLQRVLMKKRDPLTHELFISVVAPTSEGEGGGDDHPPQQQVLPLDRFWEKMVVALTHAFATAFSAQRGGFARDALVQYYPRLASLMEATCARIIKDGFARDIPDALSPLHASALLSAPKDAENAYLSGVHARLHGAALAAFTGGTRALPTAADLQTFVARAHEELKAAGSGGDRLATLVASVVGTALHTVADRAEAMAAGGSEIRAIGGGGACTAAQARNISLCNALQEVHRSVGALTPRLPPTAAAALLSPVDGVQAAALDLIAPLFRAMVDAAQERILKMYSLNLGADVGAEGVVVETSAYMKELVRLLTQIRIEYLSKFTPPPGLATQGGSSVARALVERMTSRLLLFFVRHAALVRPLSHPGKLQLAKDIGEFEAGITQQLLPAEQLGAPLRALRAFRRLLFTETDELVEGSAVLKDLPRVAVLHHLFSRAPVQLESPHTRSKLSPTQYSLWLDEHSQGEAIKFARTAAEAGAAKMAGNPEGTKIVTIIKKLSPATLMASST